MPEIIETTVYRLDELDNAAKDRARAWYRQADFDHDWFEFVYDDFERICEILGVTLETRTVRLHGGRTRPKPCIWFSGFWSQGDGASFEGYWSHSKGAAARIRDYAPTDATLHGVADRLQAIQRRNFYQLAAEVSHRPLRGRPAGGSQAEHTPPRRRTNFHPRFWGAAASQKPDHQ